MSESESIAAPSSISGVEIPFTREPQRNFFCRLVEFLWPIKPAYELHLRTGATERMCRYWLAGEHQAPWSAVSVVLGEIIRRLD